MISAVIWLCTFHYYTAFTGFLAYIFILFRKIRVSALELLFLFGLIFLMYIHSTMGDVSATILNFRYHWGWVVFYFIFKGKPFTREMLSKLLVILSIMTLVEAALVNTIVTTSMLPNFPPGIVQGTGSDGGGSLNIFGVYQRPFSFAGMAPVAGPLLVALIALCNVHGWRFVLSLMAIMSLASGTGFFVLFLVLLVRYRNRLLMVIFAPIVFLLPWFILSSKELISFFKMLTEKVSLKYLTFLADLLWLQVLRIFEKVEPYIFFVGFPSGSKEVSGHGGDWGLLSFVGLNGILGFFLLFFMVFSRMNKLNRLPLLILLISSIHYFAIGALPGQMLFGLLLALNKNNFLLNQQDLMNKNFATDKEQEK